jgi:hypothetical protein
MVESRFTFKVKVVGAVENAFGSRFWAVCSSELACGLVSPRRPLTSKTPTRFAGSMGCQKRLY